MGKLRPFVRKDSYMPNKKWIPFVIGNGYTTTDGASGPAPEYETVTGNPVSFNAITPFPLRHLSVAFSPVQDLNGYDSPWPAGASKNKIEAIGEWNVGGDGTVTTEAGYTSVIAKIAQGQTYTTSKNGTAAIPQTMGFYSTYPSVGAESYDGQRVIPASATFTAPIDGYVLARMANTPQTGYQLETGSSATSYVPFENLCPILGWDSLNVEQRGKNLFAPVAYAGGTYNPTVGTTWTLTEITGARKPVLTEDGFTVKASANNQTWTFIQPVKYGVDYYLSVKFAGDVSVRHSIGYLDKNFKVLSRTNNTSSGAHTIEGQIDPPENAAYRYLLVTNATATTETTTFTKPSLVIGDSAVEYVPYNGRSISITLGSTVYSGYVDVVTGVGEVTHRLVDLGSVNWIAAASTKFFYTTAFSNLTTNLIKATGNDEVADVYCSIAKKTTRNTINDLVTVTECLCAVGGGATGRNVQLSIVGYTPADGYTDQTFKTAMAGVQFCYELETPIPISLTPQEVESLAGDNTMWSDANGDLTVEYRSN